jgi:hypothetical protein
MDLALLGDNRFSADKGLLLHGLDLMAEGTFGFWSLWDGLVDDSATGKFFHFDYKLYFRWFNGGS